MVVQGRKDGRTGCYILNPLPKANTYAAGVHHATVLSVCIVFYSEEWCAPEEDENRWWSCWLTTVRRNTTTRRESLAILRFSRFIVTGDQSCKTEAMAGFGVGHYPVVKGYKCEIGWKEQNLICRYVLLIKGIATIVIRIKSIMSRVTLLKTWLASLFTFLVIYFLLLYFKNLSQHFFEIFVVLSIFLNNKTMKELKWIGSNENVLHTSFFGT